MVEITGTLSLLGNTIITDRELETTYSDFYIVENMLELHISNELFEIEILFTLNFNEIIDLYVWAHKHHDIIHRAAHGLPYEKPITKDIEGVRYNVSDGYKLGSYPIRAENLTISKDGVLAGSLVISAGQTVAQIKVKHLFTFNEIMRLTREANDHIELMHDTFIENSTVL